MRFSRLDDGYLEWLYNEVTAPRKRRPPSKTYWKLLRLLYAKEFVWFIPNDDNRIVDGIELRHEFLRDCKVSYDDVDTEWIDSGCSVLELLVGLSRRLSFEGDGEPREWFWKMVENLDLHTLHDGISIDEADVDETLETFIWRRYSPDGQGGLFPLEYPEHDQRDVEIWYQLNAYLIENE